VQNIVGEKLAESEALGWSGVLKMARGWIYVVIQNWIYVVNLRRDSKFS